ncbi:hypothetical protein JKP88DRAFT_248329 [Tribonema minus]|uniref:Uncharacterized protein n=1 Tax=Tribonema minus TaxID=303371 RepID=A0A835YN04_9STRA|nr:hypothetical protein JKP88DRAFT_248329 [Tribonema minus]
MFKRKSDCRDLDAVTSQQCKRCKVIKDVSCYTSHPTNKSGLQAYCEPCAKEYGHKYFNSDKVYVIKMVSDAAANSRARRLKRREMGSFSFTTEDVEALRGQQGGRCELSGIPVVRKMHSNWQESPDRIDTTRDYTRHNVRLVALEFNGSCQWTPAKIQYAFLTQHEANAAAVEEEYQKALLKPPRRTTATHPKIEWRTVGRVQEVKCNRCNDFKHPRCFYLL